MLDNRTVLGKTDSGRDAIANRTHNLNPRQRALLISINGEMDVGTLLGRFGSGTPEAAATMIEALVERGLVAPLNAPVAAMAAAPDAKRERADASAQAGEADAGFTREENRSGSLQPQADGRAASNGLQVPVTQPVTEFATGVSWRDMQQRAGDSLHAAMGTDADLLAMRIMRSRSEAEFMSHMERAFDLIRDSRGEAAARTFHDEVSGLA